MIDEENKSATMTEAPAAAVAAPAHAAPADSTPVGQGHRVLPASFACNA